MALSMQNADFFPARLGQTLHDGCYEVIRKLSSGMHSSTWLVKDTSIERHSKYFAAKVLTLNATVLHHNGQTHELEVLKAIAAVRARGIGALPKLVDHFEIQGPRGSHMCFIMDLLSTDLSSFLQSAPTAALAPYIVKNILLRVLQALVRLHALGIVHADVKLDNILFNGHLSDIEDLDHYLSVHPVAIQGEYELDGQKYPILHPQPIPHEFTWQTSPFGAEFIMCTLANMGQAQRAGILPTVNASSGYESFAPELILQSDFGSEVDIWAIGCITFELLVGHRLFDSERGEGRRFEDDHLAKMMELTGERFSKAVLERSRRRDEYFDDKGNLLRIGHAQSNSLEEALGKYNILSAEEIGLAASFIRACLHLDPAERPSAKDLASHQWLKGACFDGSCHRHPPVYD